MANELFTIDGKRKYLTAEELDRFLKIAAVQERAELRTFCLVMAYTGCRPAEALALTAESIDLSEKTIIFRTLKQGDKIKYRSIPIPDTVLNAFGACPRHPQSAAREENAAAFVSLEILPSLQTG